jgi:hypothetical protein
MVVMMVAAGSSSSVWQWDIKRPGCVSFELLELRRVVIVDVIIVDVVIVDVVVVTCFLVL